MMSWFAGGLGLVSQRVLPPPPPPAVGTPYVHRGRRYVDWRGCHVHRGRGGVGVSGRRHVAAAERHHPAQEEQPGQETPPLTRRGCRDRYSSSVHPLPH